jgi:hypothetical protein
LFLINSGVVIALEQLFLWKAKNISKMLVQNLNQLRKFNLLTYFEQLIL